MQTKCKLKRSRLQIGLKGSLAIVTGICCWFGAVARQAELERHAVDWIVNSGGSFGFEPKYTFKIQHFGLAQHYFNDISSVVDAFRHLPTAPPVVQADLVGASGSECVPNLNIDFLDIGAAVDAFKGNTYWASTPCTAPCP